MIHKKQILGSFHACQVQLEIYKIITRRNFGVVSLFWSGSDWLFHGCLCLVLQQHVYNNNKQHGNFQLLLLFYGFYLLFFCILSQLSYLLYPRGQMNLYTFSNILNFWYYTTTVVKEIAFLHYFTVGAIVRV